MGRKEFTFIGYAIKNIIEEYEVAVQTNPANQKQALEDAVAEWNLLQALPRLQISSDLRLSIQDLIGFDGLERTSLELLNRLRDRAAEIDINLIYDALVSKHSQGKLLGCMVNVINGYQASLQVHLKFRQELIATLTAHAILKISDFSQFTAWLDELEDEKRLELQLHLSLDSLSILKKAIAKKFIEVILEKEKKFNIDSYLDVLYALVSKNAPSAIINAFIEELEKTTTENSVNSENEKTLCCINTAEVSPTIKLKRAKEIWNSLEKLQNKKSECVTLPSTCRSIIATNPLEHLYQYATKQIDLRFQLEKKKKDFLAAKSDYSNAISWRRPAVSKEQDEFNIKIAQLKKIRAELEWRQADYQARILKGEEYNSHSLRQKFWSSYTKEAKSATQKLKSTNIMLEEVVRLLSEYKQAADIGKLVTLKAKFDLNNNNIARLNLIGATEGSLESLLNELVTLAPPTGKIFEKTVTSPENAVQPCTHGTNGDIPNTNSESLDWDDETKEFLALKNLAPEKITAETWQKIWSVFDEKGLRSNVTIAAIEALGVLPVSATKIDGICLNLIKKIEGQFCLGCGDETAFLAVVNTLEKLVNKGVNPDTFLAVCNLLSGFTKKYVTFSFSGDYYAYLTVAANKVLAKFAASEKTPLDAKNEALITLLTAATPSLQPPSHVRAEALKLVQLEALKELKILPIVQLTDDIAGDFSTLFCDKLIKLFMGYSFDKDQKILNSLIEMFFTLAPSLQESIRIKLRSDVESKRIEEQRGVRILIKITCWDCDNNARELLKCINACRAYPVKCYDTQPIDLLGNMLEKLMTGFSTPQAVLTYINSVLNEKSVVSISERANQFFARGYSNGMKTLFTSCKTALEKFHPMPKNIRDNDVPSLVRWCVSDNC